MTTRSILRSGVFVLLVPGGGAASRQGQGVQHGTGIPRASRFSAPGTAITRSAHGCRDTPDDGRSLNQMPVWSPNGQWIAFMSTRAGYPSIFVMNDDGSEQTNLTPKDPAAIDADWNSRTPSWSHNGHQIYFTGFRPDTGLDTEIFVMNEDGSG
jgi:WD40 repeat protein